MNLRQHRAFTMVELLVVLGCFLLISFPAWQIFRQGTKSSAKGMLQIETTLGARRILKQVTTDLKQSCWVWNDRSNGIYTLSDILAVDKHNFFLYTFPRLGTIQEAISPEVPPGTNRPAGKFPRRLSEVVYELRPSSLRLDIPMPIFQLVRTERFHPDHPAARSYPGKMTQKVLSDRVTTFRIEPYLLEDPLPNGLKREFFWITLRIVDSTNPQKRDFTQTQDHLYKPSPDLVVASFFDIAYPEFYAVNRQMAGPHPYHPSYYQRNPFVDGEAPGPP